MRLPSALPFVLLLGGLSGCGAGASQSDAATAESEARAARAEATRERARLVEIEARLIEMERRWTTRMGACEGTPEPRSPALSSGVQPQADPLRSEGDFLAEARVPSPAAAPAAVAPVAATPAAVAPVTAAPAEVAIAATPQPATPLSEQERLEQLLEGLREYAFDPQGGLSRERREALRIL
ncbi:MAG TPA: hypothetical protein VGK73_22125, partial [Polyangiaceae bacterium]